MDQRPVRTLILFLLHASAFFSVQCQLLTLVASGLSSTIQRGSPSPHFAIIETLEKITLLFANKQIINPYFRRLGIVNFFQGQVAISSLVPINMFMKIFKFSNFLNGFKTKLHKSLVRELHN